MILGIIICSGSSSCRCQLHLSLVVVVVVGPRTVIEMLIRVAHVNCRRIRRRTIEVPSQHNGQWGRCFQQGLRVAFSVGYQDRQVNTALLFMQDYPPHVSCVIEEAGYPVKKAE